MPYPAVAGHSPIEGTEMNKMFVRIYLGLHDLQTDERGQDLIEYALMMALISLALISGINGIARAVNTTFTNISSSLA
jgi:pilus assembly protein Flp/PilA